MQTNVQDLMRKHRSFSVRTRYPEAIKTNIPEGGFQEKRKATHQRIRTPENRLSMVSPIEPGKVISSHQDGRVARAFQRSKSDVVKHVVIDESRNVIRKIEMVRYEPSGVESDEERDEYACLSNEELNRRVEDFIKRFNMEIRLQANP